MSWITDYSQFLVQNLDFLETFILSTSVVILDKKVLKSMKLRKDYIDKKVKIIEAPLMLEEYKKINYEVIEDEFRKDIIKFGKILEDNFDKKYSLNFNNNIASVVIKKNLKNIRCAGIYYPLHNEMELKSDYDDSVLFHELLHLASSTVRSEVVYTGFSQITSFGIQGTGLNEGYTEYLNLKYFSPKSEASRLYSYLVNIATLIEKIIGKDNMQSYYFNSDLFSLCNNISNYITLEEINKLIKDLDYIYECFHVNIKELTFQTDLIIKAFNNINSTVLKMYTKKLLLEKDDYNEIESLINEFILLLPLTYYSGYKTYYFEDNVDLKENANKIINSNLQR